MIETCDPDAEYKTLCLCLQDITSNYADSSDYSTSVSQ